MSCPLPPAKLAIQEETLKAGVVLHNLYTYSYGAGTFHPGTGSSPSGLAMPTRFAPIRDAKGNVVPYLYLGDSLQCAIFETIFHNVDYAAADPSVVLKDFEGKAHCTIKTTRSLKLAKLNGTGLKKLKVSRLELIESLPVDYEDTAKWAERIHNDYPDVDGLVWQSRQLDERKSYVFFGGRVKASDFVSKKMTGPLMLDPSLKSRVIAEALAVNILVI
jgi:hypothetical protein